MNPKRHVPASDPRDLAEALRQVIRRWQLRKLTRFVVGRRAN